jgi:hypothetical protein
MASDAAFVEFLVDQMSDAGRIASRKMFGEYAINCDAKVVAYPGAKQYFLVEDRFEDREWLSELIRITTREVPDSKPKEPKSRRTTHRTLGRVSRRK